MKTRYKRKFTEIKSYKEILLLCKFLKNHFNMKFIVIGGSAFAIYTQTQASDLDIVVFDYGTLSEEEVDRVIAKDKNGNLMKVVFKGIEIDLLVPGQEYKEDGIPLFKIPSHFNHIENINGIEIVSKEDVVKMSKEKDKEIRKQYLLNK